MNLNYLSSRQLNALRHNEDVIMQRFGFTLIELLVVIAIISLLSSVILSSIGGIRDRAKVAESLSELDQLETTITQYNIDTGVYPPSCRTISTPCTATSDPLQNDLGVSGWDGPYGQMYDRAHGWGGHIGFQRDQSAGYFTLVLDDDPPGGVNDDSGAIPPASIHALDEQIDNDDGLKSGRVQACIWTISTGSQSAIIFMTEPDNSFSYYSGCLNDIPDS
jgi:prepilin-type N-terminal cleavage/methylation domain-containing protein